MGLPMHHPILILLPTTIITLVECTKTLEDLLPLQAILRRMDRYQGVVVEEDTDHLHHPSAAATLRATTADQVRGSSNRIHHPQW